MKFLLTILSCLFVQAAFAKIPNCWDRNDKSIVFGRYNVTLDLPSSKLANVMFLLNQDFLRVDGYMFEFHLKNFVKQDFKSVLFFVNGLSQCRQPNYKSDVE